MMDCSYTYVMIGNGFDLELGLPTGYSDFLRFLDVVETICREGMYGVYGVYGVRVEPETIRTKYDTLNISILDKLLKDVECEAWMETWKPGIENFWYKHFQSFVLQKGWIDFENEISRVIQILEKEMLDDGSGIYCFDNCIMATENSEFQRIFKSALSGGARTRSVSGGVTYRDLRDKLWEELNAFIRCFETYLREYVGIIPLKPTDNIKSIISVLKGAIKDRRYVLSFNYTDTLERLLSEEGVECEFCYVHGKVGDGKTKNNMVLGIDEYLDNESAGKRIEFASFKKYNQRIYKCTDSNYIDWLNDCREIKNSTVHKKLIIFGHSLGLTDKDIIGDFVKAEGMETTVFYHNDRTFNSMVSNMTAIIGVDEMIARNGGRKRTMKFQEQLHS